MPKRFLKKEVRIGVIGGSGHYEMEGMEDISLKKITTPFGTPSDKFILGTLKGAKIAFLPRHGRRHKLMPTEINFRANIYGMKALGVERIISVSAVGSMKEDIEPGDIVIPDQFYDHTKQRKSTFFGDGIVGHVSMADPVCPELTSILYDAGKKIGARVHKGGTYFCIEGPQFSTRAESMIYRKWGVDVIGMTNIQEAKLAREAEICYATLALATDYDCWHEHAEDVTVDIVVSILEKNVDTAKRIIIESAGMLKKERNCSCHKALEGSIITNPEAITQESKKRLGLIVSKYIK